LLSVGMFAAGIGTGIVGSHLLSPRPDRPNARTAGDSAEAPRTSLGDSPRTGLYTDDEIRRVLERWTARDPHDQALLRVVPKGASAPLLTVFGALGLDVARLGKPGATGLKHFLYLTWQVSPACRLLCRTTYDDTVFEGDWDTDPKRNLSEIRIVE
jgi:hypothetical protein